MMDRLFSRFIEKLGTPTCQLPVADPSIDLYTGRLPHQLLDYWSQHGWCGFGKGIFWLVNPQEYDCVVNAWLENTKFAKYDNYHLIARSAFGDLYFWGEKTGASLKISSILSRYVTRTSMYTGDQLDKGFPAFLLSISTDSNNYGDLFEPAYQRLGPLAPDEMYGFVPAIMLGGPNTLEHLAKLKAVEHLILLSQLASLQGYDQ